MGGLVGTSIGTLIVALLFTVALVVGISALLRPLYIWLLGINEVLEELRDIKSELRASQSALYRLQQSITQPGSAAASPPAPTHGHSSSDQPTVQPSAGRALSNLAVNGIACPKCGVTNRADRRVCWECGAPLPTE